MKYIFSLLLCFSTLLLIAQSYHPGSIKLISGIKKTGLVKPPNDAKEKFIEFKAAKGGEVIKYPSEEVLMVTVEENGQSYNFHYLEVDMIVGGKLEEGLKYKREGPFWLVELESGPATLYAHGNSVKVRKDGSLIFTTHLMNFIYFYFKNDSYPEPTYFSYYSPNTSGQQKWFRKMAAFYLDDEPAIVERIENKEWINTQIVNLFRTYNGMKVK